MATENGRYNAKDVGKDSEEDLDDWDKRILNTGCGAQQIKMNDCYFEKRDWRACAEEMEAFKRCWKDKGNDQRTDTANA